MIKLFSKGKFEQCSYIWYVFINMNFHENNWAYVYTHTNKSKFISSLLIALI